MTSLKHTIKRLRAAATALAAALLLPACDEDLEQDNDVLTNYNALWTTLDQKYCFFPYKQDSILDWRAAYNKHLPTVLECRTTEEVFYAFGALLNELKDGHVNLTSDFDVSRYDLQGPFADNLVTNALYSPNYLGRDYRRAGGLSYKILPGDSVGYIYYPSFSAPFSMANINSALRHMAKCPGIIIDIRGNGGGMVTYAEALASHFAKKKTLTGYYQRKTGPDHEAFSAPEPQYVGPSTGVNITDRPIVVLTNRKVYSAANLFTTNMKALDNVTIVGDKTGGGSGMPIGNELPCGWTVRFSSSILLDKDKRCMEWGVEPDVRVDLDLEAALLRNEDSMIETAREIIDKK